MMEVMTMTTTMEQAAKLDRLAELDRADPGVARRALDKAAEAAGRGASSLRRRKGRGLTLAQED